MPYHTSTFTCHVTSVTVTFLHSLSEGTAFIDDMIPNPPAFETAEAREASAIHAIPP